MTTPSPEARRFEILQAGGWWWLYVPKRVLFDGEHGRYHRRTFSEIVKVMDDFISRARVSRQLQQRLEVR